MKGGAPDQFGQDLESGKHRDAVLTNRVKKETRILFQALSSDAVSKTNISNKLRGI